MGAELLSWIDPTGVETTLNGEGAYLWEEGRQGFYGVPTSIVSQVVPQQPGERVKYLQIAANILKLPLLIKAGTEGDLAMARRALVAAMNPQRGVGTLRNTAPDGLVRDVPARLIDGLMGDESNGARGPGWLLAGLQFEASEPYWQDVNSTIFNAPAQAGASFFAAPFLPLKLSSSAVSGGFTIVNSGDVECWPILVITGPGTNPTITNQTTGDSLALTIALTAGQVLTIDTRPGKKTVTREDGSNQWAAVSSASTLWPLARGINQIALAMTGTTAASAIQLQYKQRYLGV